MLNITTPMHKTRTLTIAINVDDDNDRRDNNDGDADALPATPRTTKATTTTTMMLMMTATATTTKYVDGHEQYNHIGLPPTQTNLTHKSKLQQLLMELSQHAVNVCSINIRAINMCSTLVINNI